MTCYNSASLSIPLLALPASYAYISSKTPTTPGRPHGQPDWHKGPSVLIPALTPGRRLMTYLKLPEPPVEQQPAGSTPRHPLHLTETYYAWYCVSPVTSQYLPL